MITLPGDKYNQACNKSSSINEHLPTLLKYGKKCNQITEMGVRKGESTWAWIYSFPKKLICYDLFDVQVVKELKQITTNAGIDFNFIQADTTKVEIEKTDLLFIDTFHSYGQLKKELELHAKQVRKYIILHDTTSFEFKNEPGYAKEHAHLKSEKQGLWPAIEEFIQNSDWFVEERFFNNNGLTVLSRKSGKKYFSSSVESEIILVGGGSSILDKPNGSIIDSFEKVVRYSYFKTQGFEEYSGQKTNYWWTVNTYKNEDISKYDTIFTHSYEHKDTCKVYNSFKDKSKLVSITPEFSNSLTKLVPFPSSGLISIFWFLQSYDRVTITGFDWWKTSTQHYFNSQVRGKAHTPYLEKQVIDNLCDEEKIKILI